MPLFQIMVIKRISPFAMIFDGRFDFERKLAEPSSFKRRDGSMDFS